MTTRLQKAIDENAKIYSLKSGSQSLTFSGGKIQIATPAGKLTKLGKEYYKRTGLAPQRGAYDPQTDLKRKLGREYVVFRDGSEKLARSWDPSENDFKYTRLGRAYFQARGQSEEYILNLPVTITGVNKKTGVKYTRTGYLPHGAIGIGVLKVPVELSQNEKDTKLKEQVMGQINADLLLSVSDETYALADGQWKISKLITKVAEDGDIHTNAILNRPLANGKPYSFSHLRAPGGFHPSVFDETQNCVAHQLAACFDLCEKRITETLEDIKNERGHIGTNAHTIIEWCKRNNISIHLLYGPTLIFSWTLDKRKHRGTF